MKKLIAILLVLMVTISLFACGTEESTTNSTIESSSKNTTDSTIESSSESSTIKPIAKFTVVFDSAGGTAIESQIIEDGNKATEPQQPTKGDDKFEGWYYGDEKWSFARYIVTEDIVLLAKWTDAPEVTTPAGWKYFEAEGVDFTNLASAGYANSYVETQMIFGKNTPNYFEGGADGDILNSISNGYMIGCMTTPSNNYVFTINSDTTATDCQMKIRMAIVNGPCFENGIMKLNNTIMSVSVNGVELDYDDIEICGGNEFKYCNEFKSYDISSKFNLIKGENEIVLKVVANDEVKYVTTGGADGGAPSIDRLEIKSTSNLTWNSKWEENKKLMGIKD